MGNLIADHIVRQKVGAAHRLQFFYNPQRKHVRNGMLSPIAFEQQQQQQKLKLQGV